MLKECLDPPVSVYDKTRKYYDMHWTSSQYVDDYFVRMWKEAKLAKHTTRQACINMVTQLPGKIAGPAKAWIEERDEDITDEEARKFMVKVRSLLVGGGFPVDYGWRKGLPENICTIGNKGEEERSSMGDAEAHANQNEVQFVRSRPWGRGTPPRESRTGSFNCYYCKRAGHGWRDCPERMCNKCGKKGHDPFDTQCPLSYRRTRSSNRYTNARDIRRVNESDFEEKINVLRGVRGIRKIASHWTLR